MTTQGRRVLVSAIAWFENADLLLLLAVLVVVLGTWGFIALADEVAEGGTQHLDERIILALRQPPDRSKPIGPDWLGEAGRDLTALGGFTVLSLVTLGVAGYLAIVRKFHALGLLLAATLGGLALSTLLKWIFDRPRPQVVPHLSQVYTSSFPSGHSLLSAVVYLTLGALLARFVESKRLKTYFLALALLLIFLVGVSRVYLGVHYPTDVLAGWTAGLIWAVLCWLTVRYLQKRGVVESHTS